MDAVIGFSCNRFVTAEKGAEVEAFFAEHPFPQNVRGISQVVENMRANGAFLDKIKKSQLMNESFWA